MIPICMRETVSYKDSDGIIWLFKPKSGAMEAEYLTVNAAAAQLFEAGKVIEGVEAHRSFFDNVVLGWSEEGKRMPSYPVDKKPSKIFNADERSKIIEMWAKSGEVSSEEKKS